MTRTCTATCDKTYGTNLLLFVDSRRNKKLSYRRGTAQRAVSVKTVLNVAQMFVELHVISPALGE